MNSPAEYQAKRDMVCASLTRAGLTPSVPTGAYYILADATRIPGTDAKAKSPHAARRHRYRGGRWLRLLRSDERHNRGENLLRFCFAKNNRGLEDAARRLGQYRP